MHKMTHDQIRDETNRLIRMGFENSRICNLLPQTPADCNFARGMLGLPDERRITIKNIPVKRRKDSWSKEQDKFILDNPSMSLDAIAKALGRSRSSIHNRRWKLGTRKPTWFWTEEEDKIIKDNIHLSNKELAELLPNRNADTVNARKGKLGLTRIWSRWTPEENKILQSNTHLRACEIQKLLPHRSEQAINVKRCYLGIKQMTCPTGIKWTDDEVQTITDNPNLTIKELAELLPNRSKTSIIGKRYRINNPTNHQRRTRT